MKKSLVYLFGIVLFFMMLPHVNASSCSVSASSTTVSPGGTVKIYVTGKDLIANIGSIRASSGSISGISDTWIENSTTTATFKAPSSGSAKITVSLQAGASNGNGNAVNVNCNSVTIKVSTNKPTTTTKKPNKSSNNNLASLGIEGYDITPAFDKNKTEYFVVVPYDTTSIQINAFRESNKATLMGDDGVKNVSTGDNKFEVIVKAEDGSKKSYKLNVIVDSKPIEVDIDGKKYTMIKNEDELSEISAEHEIYKLNIEDEEIPAYRIDKINYILVGLKDENNDVRLYRFISYKDPEIPFEYHLYNEINSMVNTVLYLDMPESKVQGYKSEIIDINGTQVKAYQKEKGDFYLIYALNVDTNEESLYQYDKKEGTLQRYVKASKKVITKNDKMIFIIIIGIISLLYALIRALRKRKIEN